MKRAKISTDVFNRIIGATKNFCDRNSARKQLINVRLEFDSEKNECVAIGCDGYTMSVEHAVADCEESFSVFVSPMTKLPKGENAIFELHDDELIIRCGELIFDMKQTESNFIDWRKPIPASSPVYTIAFNGDYLFKALQAAKVSAGGRFKNHVILEVRDPMEAIILKTNDEDIKLVFPIRISKPEV